MTSNRDTPCFSSRYTACESRSRNIDAITLPVVICWRPAAWTCIAARCSTRWNARVWSGPLSSPSGSSSTCSSRKRSRSPRSFSISPPHLVTMSTPLGSSRIDSSRCSRVRYSWRRPRTSSTARCSVACSSGDSMVTSSVTSGVTALSVRGLDRELQRELLGFREVRRLGHLGLGDLERVHPGDADPVVVDVAHDRDGVALVLVKHGLQHPDHELARRVIVVVQQDLVHRGLLGARAFIEHQPRLSLPLTLRGRGGLIFVRQPDHHGSNSTRPCAFV